MTIQGIAVIASSGAVLNALGLARFASVFLFPLCIYVILIIPVKLLIMTTLHTPGLRGPNTTFCSSLLAWLLVRWIDKQRQSKSKSKGPAEVESAPHRRAGSDLKVCLEWF